MSHSTKNTPEPTAYELASRIAEHMTGPARWSARRRETLDPDTRFAELVRLDDGAELGVTVGGYHNEGRVTFRAHWPKYRDGQTFSPRTYLHISCNASRDPQALARDIERRLLADYNPAYRKALDEVRASDAAARVAWDAAERIARAVGATLPDPERRPTNGAAVRLHGGPADVDEIKVHPPYGDNPVRVSFDATNLDEKTALEVLAILARRAHA